MCPDNVDQQRLQYDYGEFSSALGKRVRQLRKEKGITLRALVVEYDFHLNQIQRIEKGSGISVPTLLRIAEVFQVPLEALVAGIGKTPGPIANPPVKTPWTKTKRSLNKPGKRTKA